MPNPQAPKQYNYEKTVRYKYDNLRLRQYFGMKAFVWVYLLVAIILLYPIYGLGVLASKAYFNYTINIEQIVQARITPNPEYDLSQTELIKLKSGERNLYVQVSNRTSDSVGYYPWVYTKQIIDKFDKVIKSEKVVDDYLLPQEDKFIIMTSQNVNARKIKIITDKKASIALKYNPDNTKYIKTPKVTFSNNKITDNKFNKETVDISTLIKNNSPDVAIKNLEVLFILRDSREQPVGIAKILLLELAGGTEEIVYLKNYPKAEFGDITIVDPREQFNYMEEDSLTLKN